MNNDKAIIKKLLGSATLLLLAGVLGAPTVAQAIPLPLPTTIGSGAYDISAQITVLNTVKASIGPIVTSSGLAGTGYSDPGTVAQIAAQSILLAPLLDTRLSIGTGLINTTANSTFPTSQSGNASSTVDNLAIALTTQLITVPGVVEGPIITALALTATTVKATASVEGYGNASSAGDTTISGLTLKLAGVDLFTLSSDAFVNPIPNYDVLSHLGLVGNVLTGLTGLKITLNEQVATGDNIINAAIKTYAIHIALTNFLLGGNLLNGNIYVAEAEAAITNASSPTPEPAVWVEMITGFGMIGAFARRRRTIVAA